MSALHTEIKKTEEHLLNSWPSLRTLVCDGWVFREAGGYTKRANSACALDLDNSFSSALVNAERFYSALAAPTIFRLTPLAGAEPDRILADRGYSIVDETIVMTAEIAANEPLDPAIEIASHCSAEWETGYAAAHELDAHHRLAHRAILERIAPLTTAHATIRFGDRAVAHGLGVIERGRLGLFDIVTIPEARRLGAARKLVSSLMVWGAQLGAKTAWLSVIAKNEKAIPLYRSLGFRELYRYHYRVAPMQEGSSASTCTKVALNV